MNRQTSPPPKFLQARKKASTTINLHMMKSFWLSDEVDREKFALIHCTN